MQLNDPKRTTSAYDYAESPDEGDIIEPSDFKHLTYDPHRLDDLVNVKEKIFYEEWKKKASSTLAYLLSDEVNTPDYENLSQRDLEVAATLIQWLGSNCGQAFLRETQEKAEQAYKNSNIILWKPNKGKTL